MHVPCIRGSVDYSDHITNTCMHAKSCEIYAPIPSESLQAVLCSIFIYFNMFNFRLNTIAIDHLSASLKWRTTRSGLGMGLVVVH